MPQTAHALDRTPWEALPADLAGLFRPRVEPLAEEIVEAIRETVPAYRRPLEGAFGRAVKRGALRGLGQFVDLMERPGTRELPERRLYVDLGRGEAREGRTLESLLSAYRIGARLAWRKIAAEGRQAGLHADTLALLAEGIFAYIDELSAASAEGWAEEQSAAAGEAERRRAALASLLVQSPPAEAAAVEEAAREAGWTLPAELAVLVWGGIRPGRETAAAPPPDRRPLLPPDSISAAADDGTVVAVVPDAAAPARRAQLERALSGRLAALGPVTAWTDAWRSARRARAAFRLAVEGVLPGERLVSADEHLPELLLHADHGLLDELADRMLAPLAHRSPAARRRLADTLRALIDHQGRAPTPRRPCTCTRRPCATGWPSCVRTSATCSRIRRAASSWRSPCAPPARLLRQRLARLPVHGGREPLAHLDRIVGE